MDDQKKTPECWACFRPVTSEAMIKMAEEVAQKLSKKWKRHIPARYFCSGACIRIEYS